MAKKKKSTKKVVKAKLTTEQRLEAKAFFAKLRRWGASARHKSKLKK
jgi:hypothetical protein